MVSMKFVKQWISLHTARAEELEDECFEARGASYVSAHGTSHLQSS